MGLEDHVELVRSALIKRMGGKSYLRPNGLIEVLTTDLGVSPLTIRQCLGRLTKERWLEGVSPEGLPFSQVKIIGYVPVEQPNPDLKRWQSVMDKAELTEQEREAFASLSTKLSEFADSELEYILDGLIQLRANLSTEIRRPNFLVSAKYLLGSSKLLSSLPGRAMKAFGIDTDGFSTHPPYVVAGGSANPEMVVLIENPASFELAMNTNAVKHCAFIATFGFGLSKQSEDYGNQLAELAKGGFNGAITLIREGSDCPPAKTLLTHSNIVFWGDLDIAGMQIYERIANMVPHLRLSAMYGPMIEAIQNVGRRHPYVTATGSGKPGQKLFQSNRQDVQKILTYCERYAVDQEIVLPEEIELLAGRALDISVLESITPPT